MGARTWEILLPVGFFSAIGGCCVAAVAFSETMAQVVVMAVGVALFGAWARDYVAAPLTGVVAWCFATGFLVHAHGLLTFETGDLVRLGGLIAVALAGCAFGHARQALRPCSGHRSL